MGLLFVPLGIGLVLGVASWWTPANGRNAMWLLAFEGLAFVAAFAGT